MKKQMLFLLVLLGAFSLLFSQTPPDTLWTKTFGGYNDDGAYSLRQTFDGGYIIAGWTESFGTGNSDVYLIKTDANGDTVWTKAYGGTRDDESFSVQQTSDSGYIAVGSTYSFGAAYEDDAWLIKTDANGDTLWTKRFGETNHTDRGNSVQQTDEGGYIITGRTESYGLNYASAWLIKTDSSGNKVWDKTFGGSAYDYCRSVRQTGDGGYIAAGETSSYGAGGKDVYLIRLSSVVGVDDYPSQTSPKKYDLYQNYPNPFNTQTTISFSNLKAGRINISICNIIGQKIKTLADGKLRIGHHQVIWNGKDENDMPVSSGIYFYKMETADFCVMRKCLLLK